MTLKLISASAVLFDGEVTSVTLPGSMGEFMVLRNHAALISTLREGDVRYVLAADDSHHSEHIRGGIVDVNSNVISVCVY